MARLILIGLLGSVLSATPAAACDCVRLDPSFPRFEQDLDAIAAYYPIATEGVVEADGAYAWRFIPTHEYRGPGKSYYPIALISDCSLDPIEMGKLIRKSVFLLLSPGTGSNAGSYEAGRCVNLLGGATEAAIRARFNG